MDTIRQINDERRYDMRRTRQKQRIKEFWGDRFVKFLPNEDKKYVSYLIKA